ncbi:PP2C family serine/threonine-protein phosphatase [Methanoregula sp.]|uniref:PP2C family protein-serine/threonine phosphatase n=1 Tax=Methanoregula sp. TaxID=2052170 RepID=UPI0035640E62
MNLTYCGRTHICGRAKNEDAFAMEQVTGALAAFTVADGLGGQPAGEVASRIAVSSLMETIRRLAPGDTSCSPGQMREILNKGFQAASVAIAQDVSASPEHAGMATTLVAALINDSFDVVIAYAGDSRAYCYGNELVQVTKDHSLVQELVRRGVITTDAAELHPDKHIVTRVVSEIPVSPDITEFGLEKNTLLLCTDGLTDALSAEEISSEMRDTDVNRICENLIGRSLRVKRDNTTIIVIRAAPRP